jgi:hypothetical protein
MRGKSVEGRGMAILAPGLQLPAVRSRYHGDRGSLTRLRDVVFNSGGR